MVKYIRKLIFVFLALGSLHLIAGTNPVASVSQSEVATIIGHRVVSIDGELLRLGMPTTVPKPVVVVFLDHQCTISNQISETLNDLAKTAKKWDMQFIGVYSDPDLSLKTLRAHQASFKLEFPLVLDAIGDLGLRLKPTVIPEAFVINAKDQIIYRGLIDNRFADLGKKRRIITEHYLASAMKAVAKGLEATIKQTTPIGCLFEAWKEVPEEVNFNRHVEPLLRANCTNCHKPAGIGPFPLNNYAQSRRRAAMIADVTESGLMPPWRPEPQAHAFRDERRLSDRQKEILRLWALNRAPEGQPEERIAASTVSESPWPLGTPDLELQMVEPFQLPASGDDIYRYFVIPTGLISQKDMIALDLKPGDPQVVHHVNVFMDYEGRARAEDAKDDAPGFSVFGTGSFMEYDGVSAIGGWAPGADPYQLPKGLGIPIWGGGDLVIEVHYHLTGRPTQDQTKIGLYFSDKPVEQYVYGLFLGTQDVSIPAGDASYCREFFMDLPEEMTLIDIAPHMHYLGKTVDVTATLPNRKKLPLISIKNWDLNWQNIYVYTNPITLPAGSRIAARFTFDNSATNPANPNMPPKPVKWGWQTDDEMCELYLTILAGNDQKAQRLINASRRSWYRTSDCP